VILVEPARAAEFRTKGWWDQVRLTDLLDKAAQETPDIEALIDPSNRTSIAGGVPRRLTWKQVAIEVARLAGVLHSLGLTKDDVILTQLPNTVECPILYLAAWRLGVIVSPLPVQHREKEIVFCANRTSAKALITMPKISGRDHLSLMRASAKDCPTVSAILAFGGGEDAIDLNQQLESVSQAAVGAAERASDVSADDVTTVCWTSGTEADPKGVPRSHNEWRMAAGFLIAAAELKPGARILTPFPLVNMSGIGSGIAVWLELAGAMVLHHPFDLGLFLNQLRDEEIDYSTTAPAILTQLLNEPELLQGIDFGRLSRIGSGSAPLSEWLVSTWRSVYGVEIVNSYGSNEGAGLIATWRDVPDPAERGMFFPRFGDARFQWSHRMGGCILNRLVDPESGVEIDEPGRPGELRVKGPTVFSGYWHAPELNEAAFDDEGWYRTGDLFEIAGDRQQFYKFVGRLKDIVLRGGMNISCEEIENCLSAHPSVREVAVVGAPDPVLGERICACVVIRPGCVLTLADVTDYLRTQWRCAVYKLPERLEFFESLPRNPTGKILKRDLRHSLNSL